MIVLTENHLEFRFPEVHEDAECSISFQRTLRIPDDNRDYPLPPGLGRFALQHVDDFAPRLPETWKRHGGVFLPMYQAEAMWISFTADYPMAVMVAAGKINALTGEAWTNALEAEPQNYMVIPDQPWLDGFAIGPGMVRQFVAMPLGAGYSAEEQLTGEAQHGGLQIAVCPMKARVYRSLFEEEIEEERVIYSAPDDLVVASAPRKEMGLAPGGIMRQKIYEDEYGIRTWDMSAQSRCFVHILNSTQYWAVTHSRPPSPPPSAHDYSNAGLPWFEYYDSDLQALEGAEKLSGLDSIAVKNLKQGKGVLDDNDSAQPEKIVKLHGNQVREGDF